MIIIVLKTTNLYTNIKKLHIILPYKHSTYLSIFFLTVSRMDVQEPCKP